MGSHLGLLLKSSAKGEREEVMTPWSPGFHRANKLQKYPGEARCREGAWHRALLRVLQPQGRPVAEWHGQCRWPGGCLAGCCQWEVVLEGVPASQHQHGVAQSSARDGAERDLQVLQDRGGAYGW